MVTLFFYVFVQDQKKEALQAAPNLLELLSFCFFIGGMSLPSVPTVTSRISLYFCSSFFTEKWMLFVFYEENGLQKVILKLELSLFVSN